MAVDHNNPQSRDEEILIATIDGTEYNKLPQSRMEELLLELKEVIEEGGGGGTSDYENLTNQPQVNGETLIGNKTGSNLGLVDAEEGKGLSTNDYDDAEKAAVAAATSAISAMKDGTDLDSFGDVEVALLDKADISDLGTAAAKDSTNAVTSGSTDLVESGAVKDAIDAAVSSAYHHAGTKTVAQLTHDLLIAANEGNVYNITDSGTTTSDFIEGIGKTIYEGSNVGICKVGNAYMFDLLSGFVDTTNFVQKSQTDGLLKNDGKSGLTTLNTEVNGDATTYPYADVITIEDAVPANLADCSVKIEPVQSGSGDPSPTNVRPITGHTDVSVEVTDEDEKTKTYTIQLGDTIYGGTVDFNTGVMTVTHKYVDMGTLGWFKDSTNVFKTTLSDGKYGVNLICSQYYATTNVNVDGTIFFNNAYYGDYKMAVCDSRYVDDTAETFATAMDGVQLVYELATPTTIQLTPQQIQLFKGQNTLTASTGQISVTVNGVSGAISSVQEQVNDHEERIEAVESGLTNVKGITDYFIDLAVGESVIIGGNHLGFVAWLGWNGLQAHGEVALDPCILIRPSSVYSFTFEDDVNMVLPTTGASTNASSLVSNVYVQSSGEAVIEFTSNPFGTANNVIVLIRAKIKMTRTA